MTNGSYDAVAEKIFLDLESTVRKDVTINEFDIVPSLEQDNKNSSPVLKGEGTVGLESWIVPHIYPYAHNKILQKRNYKNQNVDKIMPCLLGVALLNPDMPIVWSHRRELIMLNKIPIENELRLTKMTLSRKPKCTEALAHRRWVIAKLTADVVCKSNLLRDELRLSEMIANRYHSNYHAWSHRMWSMQHFLPGGQQRIGKKLGMRSPLLEMSQVISAKDFSSTLCSETFQVYSEELENSLKWISSHVSDHSGLHYRSFLISEIIHLFAASNNSMRSQQEAESCEAAFANNLQDSGSYSDRKNILVDLLKSFHFDNYYQKVAQDYIEKLEGRLTLFDIAAGLLLSELKTNHSLCCLFYGHEALWYYRRFLMSSFRSCLDSLMLYKPNSEEAAFSHQDRNGVPHRKDLKYDFDISSDGAQEPGGSEQSDVVKMFVRRMVSHENETIRSGLSSADEYHRVLANKYSVWFKHCFKLEEPS